MNSVSQKASAQAQEIFHMVATLLNSLHISLNIIIYTWLNPPYMTELLRVAQNIGLTTKRREQLTTCDYSHNVDAALKHSTLAVWTVLPNSSQHMMSEKELQMVGYNWAAVQIFTMATTAATLNGCTASGGVPGRHFATELPALRQK